MATSYMETVTCPRGHQFKIRRRARTESATVWTVCKSCGVGFDAPVTVAPLRALTELAHGTQPTHERHVEARLVKRVKEAGGEVRKVKWIGRVGAPDRVVMLPGRTIWVELKAPGKAAKFPSNAHERAQHREHERMRKMGQTVLVIDSYQQIEEMLK